MLSKMNGFEAIYLYAGKSDLRKGIDGLAALVKEQFNLNPFQKNVLFLFCGTRSDRFKGLVWEGDGFCLVYKRIEAGRLRWPRSQQEAVQLSQAELQRLLDGMMILERPTIKRSTAHKYSKLEMFPNQSVAFPERFWYTFLNEIQEGGVLDDGGKTGRTRTIKP